MAILIFVMEYAFHVYNKLSADGAAMALDKVIRAQFYKKNNKNTGAGTRLNDCTPPPPVVVCIGSDLAIGDSLGPIVGSMLRYKTQGLPLYIYGTLGAPITAKEIPYVRKLLQTTHKNSQVLAIDAAVGDVGDVGLIKITDNPLRPGAGANKQLGDIGDVSVLGIVSEKSLANYGLFNTTRLGLVYSMSEIISDALSAVLWEQTNAAPSIKQA